MHGPVRATREHAQDDPFVARLGCHVDLNPADLSDLRSIIECETTIAKRRDLVVDGYEHRKLSFIKSGFAARYKLLRTGKRQIINVLIPGDVVGFPSSFLEHAIYSVIALTEVSLQVCPLDKFVALSYRRPKFALALSWMAVQETVSNAEHIIDIGRRTPIERVARFLLEIHARLAAVHMATSTSFELPFSQEVMSDALGLSVPHLNRTLARLRNEGLIRTDERHVEFADHAAIERLAQFQPLHMTRIPPAPPALASRRD